MPNARQDQKITKNEALDDVCPKGGTHLGDNNLTYGRRGDYVRVSFSTHGTCGEYPLLKLQHIRNDEAVDVWTINMTENRHRPGTTQMNNPDIKGGHYWNHSRSWYNYVPSRVAKRVQEILDFTGVLEAATV